MGYSIGHIRVGGRKVGIVGLDDAFKAVAQLSLTDHAVIKDELLTRIRASNYIPSTAEGDYADALLRAYRRYCGEDVPEETGLLEVRVYGRA
jgi:hypothetical protein